MAGKVPEAQFGRTADGEVRWKETSNVSVKIGDRPTSDVVVRLRTPEGRDSWFYCHSEILIEKSKYFAERLSEDWPTCQILDSRNCVEVYCQELEFNFYVTALRLLYMPEPQTWHGVRNTLGILQFAINLGCQQMAQACLDYLEAVPWEEADEEEILKTIPSLGSQYEIILARLQPVDPTAVAQIFISAIHFATSSLPTPMQELKSSAQEQLEYMLTEDDDAPLLSFTNEAIRSEVRNRVDNLLCRFHDMFSVLSSSSPGMEVEVSKLQDLLSLLSDISWVCQILGKMEMMKDLVHHWIATSDKTVKTIESLNLNDCTLDVRLKVTEITCKVLEAISSGHVILPTSERLHVVKVWLPLVQRIRPLLEPEDPDGDEVSPVKMDSEIWLGLEAAFVSVMLTLPSVDQADILAEWLKSSYIRYPDLTEAFEVWCYRSKVAKRRLAFLDGSKPVVP